MRPMWVVGIVVGVLILYLGMFGLEGFGLRMFTLQNPTITNEPFDTLNQWSPYGTGTNIIETVSSSPVETPANNWLHLLSYSTGTYLQSNNGSVGSANWGTFTCEAKVRVDNWGTVQLYGGSKMSNNVYFAKADPTTLYVFAIYPTFIYMTCTFPPGPNNFTIDNRDINWHVWRWTVDPSNSQIKVYKDDAYVCTWGNFYHGTPAVQFTLGAVCETGNNLMEAHVDYFQATAGIWAPGSQPTSYIISASAGAGGTISPSGPVNVVAGGSQTFTITPNNGYQISSVIVDSVNQGAISTYTFPNVQAAHTISASFSALPPGQYAITASAGTGGSISPSGSVPVNQGGSQTFTITANYGYTISSVLVDAVEQGAITSYPFTNVQASHTISASFSSNGGTNPPSGGDILARLKAFVHQYSTPISALGGIVTLISAVVFVLPESGRKYQQTFPYY